MRPIITELLRILEIWKHALSDPKAFLSPGYIPSDVQLLDGLEFFAWMSGAALLLLVPFTLSQHGDFSGRMKVTGQAFIGVLTAVVIAMAWHFSFALVGGTAIFSGTFLGYVWAGSPYLPLSAICTLLILAGMPREMRKLAFNPASMKVAMKRMQEEGTPAGGASFGGCLMTLLMLWAGIVQLRCFSFIHEVTGWKFVWALLLSGLISIPVLAAVVMITKLFHEDT